MFPKFPSICLKSLPVKSKVVRKLVLGVKAKLTSNNVTMVTGEAQIIDKNTVRCGEETYETENLILCTGSETFIPPVPGVETVNYWTHRDALDSKELPASLVIVGGGVIGMEFASFFNSLGVQVTVVEMMDEILGEWIKNCPACSVPIMRSGVLSFCSALKLSLYHRRKKVRWFRMRIRKEMVVLRQRNY